jgi:hypothetical protein
MDSFKIAEMNIVDIISDINQAIPGSDAVLGHDAWIRVFETEEQAENEIDEICK